MNAPDSQTLTTLVSQAQVAHRLLAGFYQRFFTTLKQITQQLELNFAEWEPYITDRPCRRTKDPTEHWAWDMLPVLASRYTYTSPLGTVARTGDFVISFCISFDKNFSHENWEKWGLSDEHEPDATRLPLGDPIMDIYITRCERSRKKPLLDLWYEADDADDDERLIGQWQSVSDELKLVHLTKSLPDFISAPETVVKDVQAFMK